MPVCNLQELTLKWVSLIKKKKKKKQRRKETYNQRRFLKADHENLLREVSFHKYLIKKTTPNFLQFAQ